MKLKQRIYRLLLNLRQRTSRLFCVIIACLAGLFGVNPSANADILLVKASAASCPGDGITWDTAYKYLQDALDFAAVPQNNITQIWVAAGWYYADQSCANEVGSGQREDTFQLVKGVFLLGGFNGTETLPEQRDPVENLTILSGAIAQGVAAPDCAANGLSCFEESDSPGCLFDIDRECCRRVCDDLLVGDPICCFDPWDIHCVNSALALCGGSYHVVTAGSEIDDPKDTVIDGFEIRDGTANGPYSQQQNHGGGMLIHGEPSVIRCTFTDNTASGRGGGMSITGDFKQPHIINVIFENNPGDQALIPINGGGLANNQADPMLTNCLFVGNLAQQHGGEIFTEAETCQGPPPDEEVCGRITLINCTLVSNTADADNSGSGLGGGIRIEGTGSLETTSSIFWDNQDETGMGASSQISGPNVVVTYSDIDVMPVWPGIGNLNVDPLFVGNGDYRLQDNSIVINKGDPNENVIPNDIFDINGDGDVLEPTPDLDLGDRIVSGLVDMGAYESVACPWDLDGDCMVGIADLLELLAAWGPNPGHPADFNGNGNVGVSDLLDLLANWGLCPCGVGPEPLSLAEELEDACLSPANWDDFVAMMGDPNASQEDKDRFYCWMVHYLDHCDKCTCTHIPTCPSPDPYT